MASGVDIVGERDISLMGRGIESARLYSDRSRNEENIQIVAKFVEKLVLSCGQPVQSPFAGAVHWKDVPASEVADLLDTFLVHPLNFDFQGDSIATFLREAAEKKDALLSSWTIALLTEGKGDSVEIGALPTVDIHAKQRQVKVTREDGSLLVSGKSARVGSSPDVRHGLTEDVVKRITDTERREHPDQKKIPEDAYRAEMTSPLLLVYLLQGTERVVTADGAKSRAYRDGLVLPALGLHFPGGKDPDAPKHLVQYRLNKVAQAELLPPDIEEEGVEDDIESDD